MTERDDRGEDVEKGLDLELDPIGHALRSTYHAENHDSLGRDLTGLMLELARVGDEPPLPASTRAPVPPPHIQRAPATGWLTRLFGWR